MFSGFFIQFLKHISAILGNFKYFSVVVFVNVKHFFHFSQEVAVSLMMKVHTQGKAICGLYSKDVAETIVGLVNEHAKLNEHPLLCAMEAVSE